MLDETEILIREAYASGLKDSVKALWRMGGNPPEAGYYLAACRWRKEPNVQIHEIWFDPEGPGNGWLPYSYSKSDIGYEILAWMPIPEFGVTEETTGKGKILKSKHKHKFEPVAVNGTRPIFGGPSSTYVLIRCECGKVRTRTLDGTWALSQVRGEELLGYKIGDRVYAPEDVTLIFRGEEK